MAFKHLVRDVDFELREHLAELRHDPSFDQKAQIARNPLAYTGLRLGNFVTPEMLQLRDYVDRDQAELHVPAAVAPAKLPKGFYWGMLGNNTLGDCVPCEIIHAIECFHINADTAPPPFDRHDAIALYEAVGGYVPGHPDTDNGTDPGIAWDYWRHTGITCSHNHSNHKIAGLVGFDPSDTLMRHLVIYEFSCAQYAIELPLIWQEASEWTGVPVKGKHDTQPGSWGGHAVCSRAYDAKGVEDIVTWGEDLLADGNSLSAYLDQAAAVVSQEMLNKSGVSDTGISWNDLVSDLKTQIQKHRPIE